MSRKAGFVDEAAGPGVLELLMSEAAGLGDALLQSIDVLYGGTPFVLKSRATAVTIPALGGAGTVPGWTPIIRQVPTGKLWVFSHLAIIMVTVASGYLPYVRISRRYRLAGNCSFGLPTAFAGPTVTPVTHDVGIDEADGVNTFSYKLQHVNLLGQHGNLGASSSVVTPTAAQKRIDVSVPSTGAETAVVRIYRTLAGQGATGPWYWLDDHPAPGGSQYRDVHPDADLDLTVQPPGSDWGNPFVGESISGAGEAIWVATNTTNNPGFMVYTNQRGKRSSTTFSTGSAEHRPLLYEEGRQYANLSAIATHPAQPPRVSDFAVSEVQGFNSTPAAIAGQWVVYGLQVLAESIHPAAATAIAGTRNMQRLSRAVALPADSILVAEIGAQQSLSATAADYEVHLFGREYDAP